MKSPAFRDAPESETPSSREPSRRQVRVGEEFTVEFTSNASTGYQWKLDDRWQHSGVVSLSRHKVEPGDTEAVGSPGRELWTFRAQAPGQVTLRFTHARSWEPGSGSTEEVLVTVS